MRKKGKHWRNLSIFPFSLQKVFFPFFLVLLCDLIHKNFHGQLFRASDGHERKQTKEEIDLTTNCYCCYRDGFNEIFAVVVVVVVDTAVTEYC